jgi:hypothetical protein
MKDEIETEKSTNRWMFRKDISVGNMISMAGLVIGLFAWGNAIERRLVILEEKIQVNMLTNERQDAAMKEVKVEQTQRLDRIEDKLDAALASLRSSGSAIPFVPRTSNQHK